MNDSQLDAFAPAPPLTKPEPVQLEPVTQRELSALLNHLSQLIGEIQEEVERQAPRRIPVVLEQHRTRVYQAMTALGEWINGFLAERPAPAILQQVRQQVVTQIRDWSRGSPLLQYSLDRARSKRGVRELVQHLLDDRPTGADVAALVLNDFYKYSIGGMAFRGRLRLLTEALELNVLSRANAGNKDVRILSLHVGGADELKTLAQDVTFATVAHVTCLDESPDALRDVARSLPAEMRKNFSVVRIEAQHYATSPHRPAEPFDIIYSVSLFEHLKMEQAARLIEDCHSLLGPHGILLAGSVTSKIPSSEQVLRAWLTEQDREYRDEAAWRQVFARSGFDAGRLRFDYEPLKANVVVRAERVIGDFPPSTGRIL